MNTTLNRRGLGLVAAFALLLAACGSDAAATETTTTAAAEQSATVAETTTTTTTRSADDGGVTITKDIVYLEMNGHEYLLDVYAPDGDGPWPVVIALHGAPVFKDNTHTTVVAQAAAEAGMLVFVPNWVSEWSSGQTAEFVRAEAPAMPCALAFAQQQAAGYGGDPNRTVVYGLSAGATSGAMFVLGPTRDLTPGCSTQKPPITPIGTVLGDAEYFLHNASWWDGAFDRDLEEMQTIVAETVDPAFWNADLPARIRLWAAADGSFPRSFDDPWDEDGWFAQRDPDRTIREDLDELGELDDGVITYVDEGLLLATRLQKAGIDATFGILPGGHGATGKVPELVAYLLDAAGGS
jgi:acetyl esterase/lipase